jgi:lia operon protein LiaF
MRNVFWGVVLILFGVLFLLDNMDLLDFGRVFRTYWPALLVLWGMSILFRRRGSRPRPMVSDVAERVSGELFHHSSVFGDLRLEVDSADFKGGSASTVFGSVLVDCSKAKLAAGEHWLRLSGVFGSINVILPPDTAVSVSCNAVAGDLDVGGERRSGVVPNLTYTSPGYDQAERRLKISATQIFGDVRVT